MGNFFTKKKEDSNISENERIDLNILPQRNEVLIIEKLKKENKILLNKIKKKSKQIEILKKLPYLVKRKIIKKTNPKILNPMKSIFG